MVAIQFMAVNTQLFFNARMLKLNFWKYLGHQIAIVSVLLVFAAGSIKVVDEMFSFSKVGIGSFIISGVFYTVIVLGGAALFPIVFGLSRGDVQRLVTAGSRIKAEIWKT